MHCNVCVCKACLCMQVVPDAVSDSHLKIDALLMEFRIEKQCRDVPKLYASDNVAKD